jgi:uncharacterized OB-fold protein
MERPCPPLTQRTGDYWRSGSDGVLRIAQCRNCMHYLHPPMPACPHCHGRIIAFTPVSGRGAVHSYTINRYQWSTPMPPPYVVAEVVLDEQDDLLILTNIVDVAIDDVRIGMPVSVSFEQAGDAWIPVFRP